MNFKKVLLGTTAAIGASAIVSSAQAADLDVGVSGFVKSLVAFGDIQDQSGDQDSREFYFRNDSEVHIKASATDDETGLSYGATVEFEADTNSTNNTDETWIYISGGFGEIRLGDEDGANDNMKVGGFSVAAGTGGIDGAAEVAITSIALTNSGDATKIRYDSPVVGGLQLGVSYTPDTGHSGGSSFPSEENGDLEDMIEGGIVYKGSFSGLDIKGSVVGYTADRENGDDESGIGGGATIGFAGFTIGGGYFADEDRDVWNAGVKASLGPADVSLTYGSQDDDDNDADPTNFVIGANVGVLPGVSLEGDVSFFDKDTGDDDDGVTGVARLSVAF